MTRQEFVEVAKVLKRRFPNLTVEQVHEITNEIADVIEALPPPGRPV